MRESQFDVWLEEVNSPVSPLTETFGDVPLTPIDRRSSLPHSLRAGVPAAPAALAEQTNSEVIWDVEQASFVSHDIADATQSESLTIFEHPADRNPLDPFRFYQAPKPRPEYASPGPNLVLFDADREDGQHSDFLEAHSGEDSPTPRYPMLFQNAGSVLLNGTPFDGASGTSTRSSLRVPEREGATMRICESSHRTVTMNQGFHLTALEPGPIELHGSSGLEPQVIDPTPFVPQKILTGREWTAEPSPYPSSHPESPAFNIPIPVFPYAHNTTRCTARACPITSAHERGPYLHEGKLRYREGQIFGSSNPSPAVWAAYDRIGAGKARDGDVQMVTNFAKFHFGYQSEDDVEPVSDSVKSLSGSVKLMQRVGGFKAIVKRLVPWGR